jgi:hypothetical protein
MATFRVTISTLEHDASIDPETWVSFDWSFYLDAKDEQDARRLATDIINDTDDVINKIELKPKDGWPK